MDKLSHIILHEISHGLGIGMIKDDDGELRDVSYYLKDLYSVIEEAKADVMALYLLFYLIKQGFLTDCNITELIFTYLTGMLRSIRFGQNNHHGIANIIQWNFLVEEGAILKLQDSSLSITADLRKMEMAIEKLLTLLSPCASIALSLIKKSLDCNHRLKQNIDNCIFLDIQISVKMMSNVSTHTNQLS